MMIDIVDGRKRSSSYEQSSHIPSSTMTPVPSKNGGSLTPDRSSLLQTSKTPHHRTNFPMAYKPPVPPGYEPPSARNSVTDAHAASMRGPMHALTVISDLPFDQEDDRRQKDDDSDSQPGRIKPASTTATTPKHVIAGSAVVLHESKPIVSPPTTGRSASPSIDTSKMVKTAASFDSRCPSPMAPPNIRNATSFRSSSPVLMIGSHSPARQQHQIAHSNHTSPVKSPPRLVTSLPIDDSIVPGLGRITPSPTAFVRHMTSRQPSPARNSPLTTALLAGGNVMAMDVLDDEPPSLSGGYRMSPPRVSVPLPRPYIDTVEDEPSALTGDFSLEKPRLSALSQNSNRPNDLDKKLLDEQPTANGNERNIDNTFNTEESTDIDEDDDSLFDFEERNKRKEKSMSEESDDISQDEFQMDFQKRTQAAWQQHQRSISPVKPKGESTGQSHGVKFGKDDIVHNYDPNSGDADETFDNTTIGGRSLNSLYTKSAESEVEDIIKDIFLIGSGEGTNPGRRKFKYNPRVKDKFQSRDEEGEVTDDATFEEDDGDNGTHEDTTSFTDTTGLDTGFDTTTNDESTNRDSSFLNSTVEEPLPTKKSSKRNTISPRETMVEEKKDDDPLTDAWAFVESKINEVGAALGLDSSKADTTSQGKSSQIVEPSSRSISSKDGFGWDLWQYLLGPAESIVENTTDGGSESIDQGPDVSRSQSLEDDSRFLDLALQAAISMHHIKGYEYNTKYEMDIINDVRFSVVDLTLPLGVIFQENAKGCWVNQILPEGSAAASKGGVRVGDQLAAVDGLSAIDMTVDEIAKLIRVKKAEIELTFVRYVGPLRPLQLQEEGYEVSATPPRKKLSWSAPATPTNQTVKNEKATTPPPSSPRGILKKNLKEPVIRNKNETASSTSKDVVAASKKSDSKKVPVEPKKRFRLFGRRK